jgi:hypothetical protein
LGAFVISCYLIDVFVIGVFCAYVYLSFPGMFFSSQNLVISLESNWEMLLIRIIFFPSVKLDYIMLPFFFGHKFFLQKLQYKKSIKNKSTTYFISL